jgi:predicted AlkP superfamily phosphohydrolase/phosphomutase
MLVPAIGCSGARGEPRVIVLGIDGMDYGLARRMIEEGKLPNLARLETMGSFTPLETSVPPQSPVAWSNFITGMDSGGHGIYDFMHREPDTMIPYLSTSKPADVTRSVELGGYQFALAGGGMELLRHGQAFWEVLEDHGVRTEIVRIPANFPPSGTATRELSGMGTPDILGTYGTFSFYTNALEKLRDNLAGGAAYYADFQNDVFNGQLMGPPNPMRVDQEEMTSDFTVYLDPERPVAKIVAGDEEVLLEEGEWSDWVEVEFDVAPFLPSVSGIVRFLLKQAHPDFMLYVSPVNLDPMAPAMPISTPDSYAAELADAIGDDYYTQGMPEDAQALKQGYLDTAEFLQQARFAADDIWNQYAYVLDNYEEGLLFYYVGNLDQTSHMMWRAMDPNHPAYDAVRDAPYRHTIENLYMEADKWVGITLERMPEDTLLVVMSDHGFTSLLRSFNINTWLLENGFITLIDPERQGQSELFLNVDWGQTKAYAIGINSVYINVRGRERTGIVPESEREAVMDEIAEKLLAYRDPKNDQPVVLNVYKSEEVYKDRGHLDIAPDLIIGYAKGYRCSDETALGRMPKEIIFDNTSLWSGDHLMDPSVVPGVLFTSRSLKKEAPSLKTLAAAILAEYGIDEFPIRR